MSLLTQAVELIAKELGLPAVFVAPIEDLLRTVAAAPDITVALARAKVNAESDLADAATEAAAEAMLRGKKP